jgi:mono/diheme cytochrome c family protein
MIPPSMSRAAKRLLVSTVLLAVSGLASACGTERIALSKSNPLYAGAVLFNQRCSGCHTLSYAATHGSAVNVHTAEYNNGPDFDIRCERPVARVLYAIENGGFSGAIMPQNVVVGQQAIEVAKFVATYAGRQAPKIPGVPSCKQKPIGTLPPPSGATASVVPTASTASAPSSTTVKKALRRELAKAHRKAKQKP